MKREAELEAAFRKLRFAPPAGAGIPYEATMAAFVRGLALLGGPERPAPPHKQPASKRASAAELAAIARHAAALLHAIETAHAPACDALNVRDSSLRGPGGLATQLRVLIVAATQADVSELPHSGMGRKRRHLAGKVSELVAFHYHGLTGKEPTITTHESKARGPFFDLITAVFAALGLPDSPEVHARRAVEVWRKHPRNG